MLINPTWAAIVQLADKKIYGELLIYNTETLIVQNRTKLEQLGYEAKIHEFRIRRSIWRNPITSFLRKINYLNRRNLTNLIANKFRGFP